MKILGVNYESIAESDGVSCVIFISGCRHNCVGCHSKDSHDFNIGTEISDEVIKEINAEIDKRPFLSSLVISGGDPVYSAKELIEWLPKIHKPKNKLWLYTGFTYEQMRRNKITKKLLKQVDVLIDGLFEIEKRDITLKFRGSSNQRILLLKKGRKYGQIK